MHPMVLAAVAASWLATGWLLAELRKEGRGMLPVS